MPRVVPRIVVVTDSTASLPPELAQARGIRVVPLQVVIGARVLDEGPDGATPEVVAQALRDVGDALQLARDDPSKEQIVHQPDGQSGADTEHEKVWRQRPVGSQNEPGKGREYKPDRKPEGEHRCTQVAKYTAVTSRKRHGWTEATFR